MILLNVIIKPVWIFGIDRQVQIQVGANVYGKYFALISLAFIFNILLDIGITNYANRNIATNNTLLPYIMGNSLVAKFFLSILYAVILVMIAMGSGINNVKLLLILILLQILSSLLLFGRGVVSALQLFKTDAFLSIIDKALLIIVAGVWLYMPYFKKQFDIYEFAWMQVVTIGVTIIICCIVLAGKKAFANIKFDKKGASKIIMQSIPFALTVFFMGMHNRTDAFLLERLHSNGAQEAGVYASAYRLLDAANMLGYLFATILISYWSKLASEKPVIQKSLSFSHQLLIPTGILLASAAVILNKPLYYLLYHHTNSYAEEILQWCLITVVPYFITHIYGTLLTAVGKIKSFMRIVLLCAIINVTANVIAIPLWGAKACVLIGLCSQSLLAVLSIIAVKRETGHGVRTSLWFKYLLIAVITVCSFILLNKLDISVWAKLIAAALIWVAAMNVLQIFSIRSFLKLMSEK